MQINEVCPGNLKLIYLLQAFIFVTTLPKVISLKCYKCSMTAPANVPMENGTGPPPVRLCANFDYSDRYIVDCPYSTLCMKKIFTVNLTQPINGTLRDCANQRYDYQDYQDGRWQLKVAIEEPYAEGCSAIDDKGFRSARTEFCYCRNDLCNSSSAIRHSFIILFIATLCFLIKNT